jgi:integrase
MRRVFKWLADPDGGNVLTTNPCIGIRLLKGPNDDEGFHTWTADEIKVFEDCWPIGSKERLAFDLCLYTGLARGDVVRLGRQHVKDGVISFRMEKKRGVGYVYPPLLPVLAATIAATKTGDLTFLVSEDGTPYTKESFGNWFREACVKAKVPGRAHGLRKAGATRCAEKGVPMPQLMALFGWATEKMALRYIRRADRKLLAAQAAAALAPTQTENKKLPHLGSGAGENENRPMKTGS